MDQSWKPSRLETDKPAYLAIVSALNADIAAGALCTNSKLPTHRELADSLHLATGTVTRAYSEAERRGLIRSEGRRGTFVGSSHVSSSSLTALADRHPTGIDLSRNHPCYALDPELPTTLRELSRSKSTQSLLEYPLAGGLRRHREAGARWLQGLGVDAIPSLVFLASGAQHALSMIVAAETSRGDTIAAEKLTYPGILAVANQLNLRVVGLSCDEEGIIPDALETACKQRRLRLLYCNPSLQNPTNTVSSFTRRQAIAEIAEKYGVLILEDEIMRPLMAEHPGYIRSLLLAQTYLVVSVSKAVAAGLRIGFIVAPAGSERKLIECLNASNLGIPPLSAEIFSIWLADGTVDATVERRRSDTAERQRIAAEALRGFKFYGHQSSYHIWLELPDGWTSAKIAGQALLSGVAVAPAEVFSVDRKASIEAIRLSISNPLSHAMLKTGLDTIVSILRQHSGHNLPTV